MRLSYAVGAIALCTTTSAYRSTSPFVLLSTASFDTPEDSQLQTSSHVEQTVKNILSTCPTDRYLVAQQPSLDVDGLRDASASPNLRRTLSGENVAASWNVADVAGEVSFSEITQSINDACARADRTHHLEEVKLPPLPSEDSASRLADNDYILGESLQAVQAGDSYTIVYLTTPADESPLKGSPVHPELKRGVSPSPHRKRDDEKRDTRSFFDRNQFFTSGVFMVIISTVVLLTIVAVAMNVLSGLTISYKAYSKEMGPAAQKKQQ